MAQRRHGLQRLPPQHPEARRPARRQREDRPQATLVSDVRDGLRLIAGDPWFRAFALFGGASNLALMAYQTIQVAFLVRTVGLSPALVGVVIAATSAGGVAGAFAARPVADRIGTARATLLFETTLPVLGLLMPLAFSGAGILLFVVGGFCVAAGAVAGNVIKASFQQQYCPPHLLGRLIASTAFLGYGTIPIGALLGGILGTVLDLRTALAITAAAIPLAGLLLVLSPIRRSRDLPTSVGVLGRPTGLQVRDRRRSPGDSRDGRCDHRREPACMPLRAGRPWRAGSDR